MQEINKMRFCKHCKLYLDNDKFYEGLRRRVCIDCLKKRSHEKWLRVRERTLAYCKAKRLQERQEREGRKRIVIYAPVYHPSIPVNEETLELEDECCIIFGCGKKLSSRERLFGKKCASHQIARSTIFNNGLI